MKPSTEAAISKKRKAEKFPPPPREGTSALLAYVQASRADFRFFNFIVDTVLIGDYVSYVAKNVLDGKDYKGKEPADIAQTDLGPRTRFLRKNSQTLLEMFVSRLVDSFQKYLVDLIREILRSKPEMLSTKQQTITLEEVLRHESIEELVHDAIERRVNVLSYEGFADLQKWCSDSTPFGYWITLCSRRTGQVLSVLDKRDRDAVVSARTAGAVRSA